MGKFREAYTKTLSNDEVKESRNRVEKNKKKNIIIIMLSGLRTP